jgi:long-chain acyl-CoA synthetase
MKTSQGIRRAVLFASWLAVSAPHAAEVAGVKIEDRIQVSGQELVLNGAGLRTRFFIKVYVGALYTGQKATTPAGLIDSTAPRRMVLRMLRDMDADTLYGALDEGLRNNLIPAEMTELKPQSEQLGTLMKGIGAVKEGDAIAIDFGSSGIEIGLNGRSRGRVEGAAFARALLKVWLGDNPADAALKKGLLGG